MVNPSPPSEVSKLFQEVTARTSQSQSDTFKKGGKGDPLPLHDIVQRFQKNMDEISKQPKLQKDDFANRFKDLSNQKLAYYDKARFGFLIKFFSSFLNIFRMGTFTSSGQLGLDLVNKLRSMKTPQEYQAEVAQVETDLKKEMNAISKIEQETVNVILQALTQGAQIAKWEKVKGKDHTYELELAAPIERLLPIGKATINKSVQVQFSKEGNEKVISFPKGGVAYKPPLPFPKVNVRSMRIEGNKITVVTNSRLVGSPAYTSDFIKKKLGLK